MHITRDSFAVIDRRFSRISARLASVRNIFSGIFSRDSRAEPRANRDRLRTHGDQWSVMTVNDALSLDRVVLTDSADKTPLARVGWG